MARLGELLVQAGAITAEQLQLALRGQRQHGGRLGTHLVEMGFLSESALARTLSAQLRLPAVSAAALDKIPTQVLRLIPRDSAVHYRAVPVRLDGPHLWVAMSDPTEARSVADLDTLTGTTVRPMVAPDLLISYALERHYGVPHRHRIDGAGPPLELEIETDGTSAAGGTATARSARPPTPWDDPYTAAERAAIDARAVDLDARPHVLPTTAPGGAGRAPTSNAGRLGSAALGARLVAASSQRDVFEAALAFLAQDFQRSVVLVLRNGKLAGFLSSGRGVSEELLPDFAAPVGEIAILGKVLADGRPRLGRASAQTLGALARVLGPTGERAVLVLPVRCAGHPVGVVVAADGKDGVESFIEEYVQAAHRLDWALQILALRRRLME